MNKGLGKGLDALFPDLEVNKGEVVQEIKIGELRANPYQPRKNFQQDAIDELTQSIAEHGILQPIIIRKSIKGYEIVAGERRFRAAKAAGLEVIPAVVREFTEQQMMELALLENLQRENLTPIEEANAYQMLMKKTKQTQEELAKRMGKSRPHIANHLRLLVLPKEVQEMMTEELITMGHGRALLGLKDDEKITAVANKIVKENLNVRQTEQYIQQLNQNVPRETLTSKKQVDVFLNHYEERLASHFGTAVKIIEKNNRGKIEIKFQDKEDLHRIITMLKNEWE